LIRLRPGGPGHGLKVNLDPELQVALLVQPVIVLKPPPIAVPELMLFPTSKCLKQLPVGSRRLIESAVVLKRTGSGRAYELFGRVPLALCRERIVP